MSSKLKFIRAGHRSVISKLVRQFEEIKSSSEDVNGGTIEEEVSTILDNIEKKEVTLTELNDKILENTQENEIEEEIVSSDEYMFKLQSNIRDIRKFLQKSKKESQLNPNAQPYCYDHNASNNVMQQSNSSGETVYSHSNSNSMSQMHPNYQDFNSATNVRSSSSSMYCKLPKLNLPSFHGDLLEWQSFWDSYENAIHQNPTLSDIQKFNYLKSLLRGDALMTVQGFVLSNANYAKAISLLQERFGQVHKIIQKYMQALLEIPTPENTVNSLRNFYDKIEIYIRGLESLGENDHSFGSLLVPVIFGKLPGEIRKNLVREHGSSNLSLEVLRRSILNELNIMEVDTTDDMRETPRNTAAFFTSAKPRKKPISKSNKEITNLKSAKCAFCKEEHNCVDCIKVPDYESRIAIVKRDHLCFNCLGHHRVNECKSKRTCKVCQKHHHTSLCKVKSQKMPSEQQDHSKSELHNAEDKHSSSSAFHSSVSHTPSGNVLLKTAIAPVFSRNENNRFDANILFDEGAQRSFMTEKLAEKLHVSATGNELVHLSAFGDSDKKVRHLKTCTIFIETVNNEKIPLNVLIVPEIAVPLNTYRQEVRNCCYLAGLTLAHPLANDGTFEIELLVGADYYWDLVQDRVIRGNGPTAVSSKLGYLLSGPLYKEENRKSTNLNMMNVMVGHKIEECNLEKFWEVESLGTEKTQPNDTYSTVLHSYMKSEIFHRDGRYFAKLPWRDDHPTLPTNKAVAFQRTRSVVRRLSKEPELLKKYDEIIKEQENRGFIEKVEDLDATESKRVHYIPHHAVKKDSVTTPIRIVYDCSCKGGPNNTSLNDCLLNIPPKLNEITSILVRFRASKFASTTDIEKAFLNVGLEEEDRDATRFFWLSDPSNINSDFTTYRFKSVLFGATCSPFILFATLLKHLKDNPCGISETLIKDLYVDNILSSFQDETELLNYYKSARNLFAEAGFNLRSWSSNSKLLQQLAIEENVHDKDPLIKILGLRWNTETDTISFAKHKDTNVVEQDVTKREILKQSSSVYDPLGFLSPVTVRSKMLMQTIWEKGFDWDEILPTELVAEWKDIQLDLGNAMKTKVPRYYFNGDGTSVSDERILHVFTDASKKAYGACAYLVSGQQSVLVMAKNRVAPLKQMTIPKLELMGAVIGARLVEHLRTNIKCDRIYLWSDSQIVLSWLESTKVLRPFVAHRIKEIKQLTGNCTWKFCPTEDNPADILSRGLTFDKFRGSDLWMHGPRWILNESDWPIWTKCASSTEETSSLDNECDIRQLNTVCDSTSESSGIHNIIDLMKFSCFQKFLRVTAYILRFVTNCKTKDKQSGQLTATELNSACRMWIRNSQQRNYADVLENLVSRKKHNLIKQLNLYMDENHIIRCMGRIHNANVSDNTKFPILLPSKDRLTELIIMDTHERNLHSGLGTTVTLLRQEFWIPAIRQRVKAILHRCVPCKKVIGKPYQVPDPPPLPMDRLREAPPFTVTGVDFTGALYVKNKDGSTGKSYICLFTCASTRAIHIEVVRDLSEETFILAFRKFSSRKSLPKIMISDNASTYVSASKEIQKLSSSNSLQNQLLQQGTTWKFIPKRAPWYGGWWERLIGLTKNCIKKVLGKTFISFELLETISVEVERILNDRPLTYVSSEPLDNDPLTPSHLLYGRKITSLPYPDNGVVPEYVDEMTHETVNKLCNVKTSLIKHFWTRWKTEYLTSLREYHHVQMKDGGNINVGDVVLIQDDGSRTNWPMAVIKELSIGKDGKVRSAIIRTKHGITSRPLNKLYPFETCDKPKVSDVPDMTVKPLIREAKKQAMENIKGWIRAK